MDVNQYTVGKYVSEHGNAAAAILRKTFQTIKKAQSDSSKSSMKNNYKRERNKIFNFLNQSNSTALRQDDRCF